MDELRSRGINLATNSNMDSAPEPEPGPQANGGEPAPPKRGGTGPELPLDLFGPFSNEALADIWYALAGTEIRHPGCFTGLLEAAHDALGKRLGHDLAGFVEKRFRGLRASDAAEDAEANARATSEGSCDYSLPSVLTHDVGTAQDLHDEPPHEGGTS